MTVAEILDWHLARYPLIQAQDIYKLLHQGVFGPGHILITPSAARAAIEQELVQVDRTGPVALTEPIDPTGKLVRVNLAPLPPTTAMVERLLEALTETVEIIAQTATATELADIMRHRLAAAVLWCRRSLPLQAAFLEKLAQDADSAGFPTRHHSAVYLAAYHPAYRVLLSRLWLGPTP